MAEQLTTALGKFGLTAFGEKGDPFDPTRHEAVAHQTSADVTEPTCVAGHAPGLPARRAAAAAGTGRGRRPGVVPTRASPPPRGGRGRPG